MTERLTIGEAAERLGISPDTVRRRLKRGELEGEQEQTAQGFIWRIVLPKTPDEPEPEAAEPQGSIELALLRERVAGLERLTEELQSERDAWREQAASERDASAQLRVLLQQAQTLAGALPASVGGAGSPTESTPVAPRSRSFWDRLFGKPPAR